MILNSKNGDQINSLLNAVRIFSEDIKIKFELSKCGVLITKRGKVVNNEEINMADGKTIKNIEEDRYKNLGVLEANGVKHEGMKGQRVRKSKLNGGNIISAINSRAVSIIRYEVGIISWTKMELELLDWKTIKMMTT